jgi:serine/threonine protein kinase
VVQRLTPFIPIDGVPSLNETVSFLSTNLVPALKAGLEKLDQYYNSLPNPPRPYILFPRITEYKTDGQTVKFEYIDRLANTANYRAVYKAKTVSDGKFIVVKFVWRYGTKAHQLLASEGLAPQLFHAPRDGDPTSPTAGGRYMVVMEYVEGKTLDDQDLDDETRGHICDELKKALEILHKENIVFGDLRSPNVILRGENKPLLIDFDWAAIEMFGRYPDTMNGDIEWHPEAYAGCPMKKEHDRHMLEMLRAGTELKGPSEMVQRSRP